MTHETTNFLMGVAVGRAMKGQDLGYGSISPACWNDQGNYNYFYIDYQMPISTVTKGQFTVCNQVFYENGKIEIEDIEIYNETTLKIYCDISVAQGSWVAITSYMNSFLKYSNGTQIPKYGSSFWVDQSAPWALQYIEEFGILLKKDLAGTDEGLIEYYGNQIIPIAETLTLEPPDFTIQEQVLVQYTGGLTN